jgi:hypothetical protein
MFIAIIPGLTALLTAYASWQSSLYDGNQAESYTNGNATIADANQMYNEASQLVAEDMDTWNQISMLQVDKDYVDYYGDGRGGKSPVQDRPDNVQQRIGRFRGRDRMGERSGGLRVSFRHGRFL